MSTQQITKAMKMVAAAKLRKSQERFYKCAVCQEVIVLIEQTFPAPYEGSGQNWYSTGGEERRSSSWRSALTGDCAVHSTAISSGYDAVDSGKVFPLN